MKKAFILIVITFWTINLFAQFETGLKVGGSQNQTNYMSEGKSPLPQASTLVVK